MKGKGLIKSNSAKPAREMIKGADHYRSKEFKVRDLTFPSMKAAAEHFKLDYTTVHKRVTKRGWGSGLKPSKFPEPFEISGLR